MPRYIDLDKLNEYPIRLNHYDKENGNVNFVYGIESVLEYANHLPIFETEITQNWISVKDKMPTADVEPVKHGHWINGNCGDYVCSVCGWAFSDELPYMAREYDAKTEEIMRYCMHCGSRLELQGGVEND